MSVEPHWRFSEHVAPQLMPPDCEVTVPVPPVATVATVKGIGPAATEIVEGIPSAARFSASYARGDDGPEYPAVSETSTIM